MLVKTARSAVVAATLLAAVAANAQVVNLSRTKCKDFIEFPKETMSFLTMWLDGYRHTQRHRRAIAPAIKCGKAHRAGACSVSNGTDHALTEARLRPAPP